MRNYGLPVNRGLSQIISESPEVNEDQVKKEIASNPYKEFVQKNESRNKVLIKANAS